MGLEIEHRASTIPLHEISPTSCCENRYYFSVALNLVGQVFYLQLASPEAASAESIMNPPPLAAAMFFLRAAAPVAYFVLVVSLVCITINSVRRKAQSCSN